MRDSGLPPGADQPAGSDRPPGQEFDWAALIKEVGPRLVWYFRSRRIFVPDQDIDDGLSEAIFILWSRMSTYDPVRGTLTSWLFAIAKNRTLNILQKKLTRREIPLDLDGLQIFPQESEIDELPDSKSEILQALIQVLESLADADRLFILDYVGSRGTKDGSERVRAHRIRASVRKEMHRLGYGDPFLPELEKGAADEQ